LEVFDFPANPNAGRAIRRWVFAIRMVHIVEVLR